MNKLLLKINRLEATLHSMYFLRQTASEKVSHHLSMAHVSTHLPPIWDVTTIVQQLGLVSSKLTCGVCFFRHRVKQFFSHQLVSTVDVVFFAELVFLFVLSNLCFSFTRRVKCSR